MQIVVIRGAGDQPGTDVVDPLIATTAVGTARGQRELDIGEGLQVVRLTSVHRSALVVGQLIEVQEATGNWRARVTGVEHRQNGPSLRTLITVERK